MREEEGPKKDVNGRVQEITKDSNKMKRRGRHLFLWKKIPKAEHKEQRTVYWSEAVNNSEKRQE